MQNSAGQRERIMERGSSRQPCHPSSSCTGQPVQRVVSSVLQSKAKKKKKAAMRRLPLFIFNRCTLRYWGHTYKHRRATLRMMMGTHMCLAVDMLHLFCLFFLHPGVRAPNLRHWLAPKECPRNEQVDRNIAMPPRVCSDLISDHRQWRSHYR